MTAEQDRWNEEAVTVLLRDVIGEDVTRDGLTDTPRRVVKAYRELTEGYHADVAAILSTTFDVPYDELVVVRRVPFVSLCEHHMLPFSGHATIGYVPSDRVVGLSKLPRLLHAFARRLQVQERLTQQIAEAMVEHLQPKAVGVIIDAHHLCMSMRGVRSAGTMTTSSLHGLLRDEHDLRAEFMALHSTP